MQAAKGPPGKPPPAKSRSRKRWRQLAVVFVLLVAYAGLSYYSSSVPDAKGLGAALSIAPLFVIGSLLLLRWTGPLTALLVAALSALAVLRSWPFIENHYEWADLAQQSGVYALVAVSFGRSLHGGRIPLCTQLARTLHGDLAPIEIAYTRKATFAWGVFYALIAVAIVVLFFVSSLRVWSIFVNFATFGLIALMATGDHMLRFRLLPQRLYRGGLLAALMSSIIG